jgi:hypothetical protein
MTSRWIVTAAIGSALALGCSEPGEEGADAEGCEHLKEGPAVAVTATAGGEGAPAIDDDHRRYDVALVAVTGGMGGFVTYASPMATDYVFFLGTDVPLQLINAASAPVTPEESATSSPVCTEIKGRYLVPLEVGTYALRLGPTTETSVSIVVEAAAHAD